MQTVKRVLLIEADVAAGEDLLTAAADLGLEAYVATHEELYASYRPELRSKITAPVFTDFRDPEAALAELAAFCRSTGIDAVVPCWEFLAPLATRLAAELGLPGHRDDLADACRNKQLMAEVFAAHGVPCPRTVVASDHPALVRRIAEAGLVYPLVVKPAENAASIGVSVVRSPEELPAAVRLARSQTHKHPHGIALDTTLLAQEYVDGDEFSVETITVEGAAHHVTLTEKFTAQGPSRAELGHTVPAQLPPHLSAAVRTAVTGALAALGLRNGIAHTEVKIDPQGQPKIIEVGARPPGDHIMRLVKEALGIDVARAYLQTTLGERPDLTPAHESAAAIRFVTAPQAGIIRWISPLPQGEHIIATVMAKLPGDEVGSPHDNMGRIGQIMLRADTAAEVNTAAETALRSLTVEMATQW
ncbi:ATP-grasp domain-containing protein [Streptomyces sp. NPDC101393]|uniref:ATP-grasp domain-containing protein n=1 Tax=Streptomyces sp. NPDC101393 TaxID=3366141 RepID=UPI00380F562C